MARAFASRGDLTEKKVTFERLTQEAYAYSAEGDPTSGVVIGDDAVMVIDTRSTPVAAQDLIDRVPEVIRLSQDPRAKLQYFQAMFDFV